MKSSLAVREPAPSGGAQVPLRAVVFVGVAVLVAIGIHRYSHVAAPLAVALCTLIVLDRYVR